MAEFQEVFRQIVRLCQTNKCDGGCPLHTTGLCGLICNPISLYGMANEIGKTEKIVMKWAEEHPEPVYPTWGEYLISIGCLDPAWDKNKGVYDRLMLCASAIFTPIRSDIAVKLELEPKEGGET